MAYARYRSAAFFRRLLDHVPRGEYVGYCSEEDFKALQDAHRNALRFTGTLRDELCRCAYGEEDILRATLALTDSGVVEPEERWKMLAVLDARGSVFDILEHPLDGNREKTLK